MSCLENIHLGSTLIEPSVIHPTICAWAVIYVAMKYKNVKHVLYSQGTNHPVEKKPIKCGKKISQIDLMFISDKPNDTDSITPRLVVRGKK